MVKLLCETDFVSRSDEFVAIADKLADKLFKGEIKEDEKDVQEVKDSALKTGENIQVGEMKVVEGEKLGVYVHSNKKIGVIVVLSGGDEGVAKDVAMQVAATNPVCISPDEVPQEAVDKEKEIWKEQLANEGKPEAIVEKIMIGKEKKFREENALIKQLFVKDNEKTVEQLLAANGGMKVEKFVRMAI